MLTQTQSYDIALAELVPAMGSFDSAANVAADMTEAVQYGHWGIVWTILNANGVHATAESPEQWRASLLADLAVSRDRVLRQLTQLANLAK